jgi:hypothetical protein
LEDPVADEYGKPGCNGVHTAVVARTEVIIGEPVLVSLIIINKLNTNAQMPYAEDNWRGQLTYFVYVSQDGKEYSSVYLDAPAVQIDPKFHGRTLAPGGEWRRNVFVLFDHDYGRGVFQEGTNWLRIAHVCGWRSVPLAVTVTRPQDPDDIAASLIARAPNVSAFLCSGVLPGQGAESILSDVKTVANGKGRLSPYAALRLATYCLESQQMTDALKWAKMADVDGFVRRDKAVWQQAVSCLNLLDIERGSNLFARIRRDFPYSESACKLRYEEENLLATAKRALQEHAKAEGERNAAARWKDVPATTRKEIEETVALLMKKLMAFDERAIGKMMTDDFVRNGHFNKTQFIEQLRGDVKEAKGKRPEVATRFEQMLTDGSNVVAKMEFAYRGEGREGKKRDRMTFSQRGGKGVWLLSAWDSTPVESPEMEKWREQVERMTMEGKTNGFPERPRPK